jgi:hypothetical protein
METLIKSNSVTTFVSTQRTRTDSKTNFWEKLEFNRFAVIPILLVVIVCLGGLAASFGAGGNTIKLAIVAFPSSIATSLIIGLAPMKVVFYVSIIAIVVDLFFFVL